VGTTAGADEKVIPKELLETFMELLETAMELLDFTLELLGVELATELLDFTLELLTTELATELLDLTLELLDIGAELLTTELAMLDSDLELLDITLELIAIELLEDTSELLDASGALELLSSELADDASELLDTSGSLELVTSELALLDSTTTISADELDSGVGSAIGASELAELLAIGSSELEAEDITARLLLLDVSTALLATLLFLEELGLLNALELDAGVKVLL
jgi:hypothetical protein